MRLAYTSYLREVMYICLTHVATAFIYSFMVILHSERAFLVALISVFYLSLSVFLIFWLLFVVQDCRLNRASDAKQFRMRLQKELSDNASISWNKLSKEPHFTVAHYAGKVSYQIEGMMEKNKVQSIEVVACINYGHVHTAAKFGCQFTFYSLIAFCTHTSH